MIVRDPDRAAVAHAHELAAALVHALLRDAAILDAPDAAPDAAESTPRRREALAVLRDYAVPIAVFDPMAVPRFTNAAWRALFGPADPAAPAAPIHPAARHRLDGALRGNAVAHTAQLAIDLEHRRAYCAQTLRPVHDDAGASPASSPRARIAPTRWSRAGSASTATRWRGARCSNTIPICTAVGGTRMSAASGSVASTGC